MVKICTIGVSFSHLCQTLARKFCLQRLIKVIETLHHMNHSETVMNMQPQTESLIFEKLKISRARTSKVFYNSISMVTRTSHVTGTSL